MVSAGLGRNSLSLFQSALAEAAWKLEAGIIWRLFTCDSGVCLFLTVGGNTYTLFLCTCSSSQYGACSSQYGVWSVPREPRWPLFGLLWPSYRSHVGWFFCILFVQEVTKAHLGLQKEERDSTSWEGSGSILGDTQGTGSNAVATFEKRRLLQSISKGEYPEVVYWKEGYLRVRTPGFQSHLCLFITSQATGPQCAHLYNGDTNTDAMPLC